MGLPAKRRPQRGTDATICRDQTEDEGALLRLSRTLLAIIVAGLLLPAGGGGPATYAQGGREYEIRVEWYDPNGRWDIPLVCFEVMRQDPSIICTRFSPLAVQGGMGYESGKVMAFATGAGPDVFNMWTNQIASFRKQGFLLPLNEFVGHDGVRADGTKKTLPDGSPDVNGQIDDDEATWDYWKRLDPIQRKIVTEDGIVHSIPARRADYVGLIYRKDLLRRYGVSDEPPRDWDEFFARMQRLTWPEERIVGADVQQGRWGLYLHRYHIYLYPWVWASGGSFVQEGKTNPKTGETHWYPKEELAFIDPDTGQSLAAQPSQWRVNFTSPEVIAAYDFLWRCFYHPWVRDPRDDEPIDLTDAELERGAVQRADGSILRFAGDDVIRGVARTYTTEDTALKTELFERGEIVCYQAGVGTVDLTSTLEVRPDQLGFWAVPPRTEELPPALFLNPHWLGLSPSLAGERNAVKREKAWKIAASLGSDLGKRMYTRYMVQQGLAMFTTPQELRNAGLEEYVEEIPAHWRRDYERILKHRRYEPWNADWLQVARNDLADIFDRIAKDPKFDYVAALRAAEHRANSYVMSARPEEEMAVYRRWAMGLIGLAFVIVLVFGALLYRELQIKTAEAVGSGVEGRGAGAGARAPRNVYARWLPWALMFPALGSIALWAYYPLIRGTAMAFMDYRLMGERSWVGLDNFINVILDGQFQQSVVATLKYVSVALGLTFIAPIVLAIMLNEIPKLKQTFRTVFFLPQVSSGVVVMLLWKQFFEGSPQGVLNRIVMGAAALLGTQMQPIDWLGNDFWAPICVVLPILWAGTGMASLIYLAALKTVPDELYEAAEIDGASLWQKIRHVTLPILYPLIVINFVGAFIGTFHQMQNIFVMTGGAAGTRVLSLHIWYTAYADLKFGPATACAWILGSMLIGFTVWQLRILRRVEFRRAED